jgi:integrase
MLIRDFFETVYRPEKLFGKSENTVRLYRLSICAYEKTLGKRAELSDLTTTNLLRHMQARLDGLHRGKSRGTANKDRAQILAIWRYAIYSGHKLDFPKVPELIEPERVPRAWLREDLDKLFAAIDKMPGELSGVPTKLWWRALVMLALDTGERIGAVSPARWDWMDGQWIEVPAETRKGGRRDRRYWITPQTCGLLNRIKQYRADTIKIFPWPYSPGYLWIKYGDILKAARLPHGRQDKFHRLRKTFASVINAAGIDAQEALDHQHSRTTKRYLDPRFKRNNRNSEVVGKFYRDTTPDEEKTA